MLDAAAEDLGVPSGVCVTDLSIAGATHQCAVMSDGTVRCHGRNFYGALGLGPSGVSTSFVREPVVVPGLRGVVLVVANNNDVTCSRTPTAGCAAGEQRLRRPRARSRRRRARQRLDAVPRSADDATLLQWLAADGKLVKRPALVSGNAVRVGFKPEAYAEALG